MKRYGLVLNVLILSLSLVYALGFAQEAKDDQESRAWAKAQSSASLEEYNVFRTAHPKSPLRDQADDWIRRQESTEFTKAVQANTAVAYLRFVLYYPETAHLVQVRDRLRDLPDRDVLRSDLSTLELEGPIEMKGVLPYSFSMEINTTTTGTAGRGAEVMFVLPPGGKISAAKGRTVSFYCSQPFFIARNIIGTKIAFGHKAGDYFAVDRTADGRERVYLFGRLAALLGNN
ncbi:MAG: hypothetical protein NT096_09010 [Proteobacteria bacterium]|nr:hypothetical protein [Pseudomonadota bacterium]